MHALRGSWAPLFLLSSLAACATSGAARPRVDKPLAKLPSREAARSIPVVPVSDKVFGSTPATLTTVHVDPSPGPATPWDAVVSPKQVTGEARCAAREIARIVAATGRIPDDKLRAHLRGRCGITHTAVSVVFQTWDGADASSEAKAREHVQKEGSFRSLEGDVAGAAWALEGTRGAAVAVGAKREIDFPPVPPVPAGSTSIVLRGRLGGPTQGQVFAVANLGASGTAICVGNPAVQPPDVEVTCPLAPADPWSWVGLAVSQPGRFLHHTLAEILVVREPAKAADYTSEPPGADATTPDAFAKGLVTSLNAFRRASGLGPLTLADAESRASQSALGAFTQASAKGDAGETDRIALATMAGWDVPGTIRNAGFYSQFLGGTRSPSAWVAYAVERPLSRRTLLAADKSTLAVGAHVGDKGGGAMVTSYATFEASDPKHDFAVFAARIAAAREQAHVRPIAIVPAGATVQRATADVFAGTHPDDALQHALSTLAQQANGQVVGWTLEMTDPSVGDVPPELLAPDLVGLEIGLAFRRVRGAAWGQLVALLVANPPGVRAARADEPTSFRR